MFAKLCLLIVSFGVIACCMLAIRQQRLDAIHQATVAQRNILLHGRDLAKFRTEIAAVSTPQKVELAAAERFGTLTAIGVQAETPVSPVAPNGTTIVRVDPITRDRRPR